MQERYEPEQGREPRHSARRHPQKMADVMATLLARRGYAQVETASACQEAWLQAAGPPLRGQSRAGEVRRGVLEVVVSNSSLLQELTFRRRQLLAELNRLLPDQPIRELRFRVGSVT